jgi:hypothetical protein
VKVPDAVARVHELARENLVSSSETSKDRPVLQIVELQQVGSRRLLGYLPPNDIGVEGCSEGRKPIVVMTKSYPLGPSGRYLACHKGRHRPLVWLAVDVRPSAGAEEGDIGTQPRQDAPPMAWRVLPEDAAGWGLDHKCERASVAHGPAQLEHVVECLDCKGIVRDMRETRGRASFALLIRDAQIPEALLVGGYRDST